MPIRQIASVLLLSSALLGQSSSQSAPGQNSPSASQPTVQQPQNRTSDDLAQIRSDLERMESLNLNMSSEIEFLRDQNLQILLRTNAQMWTMLIRDLRRQIDRQEQLGGARQQSGNESPSAKPAPR